jgi:hypothetical protein
MITSRIWDYKYIDVIISLSKYDVNKKSYGKAMPHFSRAAG